ncbi:MAG: hypothetical protein ACKVXR_01515 [Planctomycetota bacterium]
MLLKLLFVAVASLVGAEIGSRLLDRLRGRPWDGEARRAEIEATCAVLSRRAFIPGGHQDREVAGDDSSMAILSPYSGWEHLRTHPNLAAALAHYRSAEGRAAYDISILGGSVAQSFAQVGGARLAQKLREDPRFAGRDVRVHDDACAGYKQPQPLMVLAYLLARGHEPDAVIEIDGFNEAALGWSNRILGANPAYPFLPNWARATNGLEADPQMLEDLHEVLASQARASSFGEKFLASGLWRSSVLGHAGGLRLAQLREDYVSAYRRYTDGLKSRPQRQEVKGPRIEADDERTIEMLVRSWEESSISMAALCEQRGILYLHVLQPALPDPGTKPLTAGEIERGQADPSWIEGVLKLYPRLREAGGRLSGRGIAFFDATGVLRDHPEEVYTDVCHFGEHGNGILADAIAGALLGAAAR